jgi:thiazole synthase
MKPSPLIIAGVQLSSRLFLGTGKYNSGVAMAKSLAASGTELVTVALRRVHTDARSTSSGSRADRGSVSDDIISHLDRSRYRLMPNTSGVRDAKEAVLAAELARDALDTNWVKLEIHPDPKYLMPDPIETLKAAQELVKRGFVVLPYVHADPVLCKQLEEAGCAAVMPLGAPIGSNRGLESRAFLEIIIAQSNVPVVIDAGLGTPSHAAAAMEMGADAVLVNTAIAAAADPVAMGLAFKLGVEAGRIAFESGLVTSSVKPVAHATSPLTAFLSEVSA